MTDALQYHPFSTFSSLFPLLLSFGLFCLDAGSGSSLLSFSNLLHGYPHARSLLGIHNHHHHQTHLELVSPLLPPLIATTVTMRASIIAVSTLAAAVLAAPVFPDLNVNAAMPGDIDVVSDYFNLLAQKVQASRWMSTAPVCDLSKAQLPVDSESA